MFGLDIDEVFTITGKLVDPVNQDDIGSIQGGFKQQGIAVGVKPSADFSYAGRIAVLKG